MATGRARQLDVLRAVAILLVLLQHHDPPTALTHRIGWTGVDLFFVLSGFLVSGLLFRELERFGNVQGWRFLARRAFKIYPAFWAMVATTIAFRLHEPHSTRALVCELLFVQNYGPGLWVHTWSLAVEEHFYFVLTFGFLWLSSTRPRIGGRRATVWAICFLTGVLALRAVFGALVSSEYKMVAWGTHARIDSLAYGTFLAYLNRHHHDALLAFVRRHRAMLTLASTLLIGHVLFFDPSSPFVRTVGFTLLYLGYGTLLLLVLFLTSCADPFSRILATLGRSSYGVYLWHLPFQGLVIDKLVARGTLPHAFNDSLFIFLASSIVAGMILTQMVERPMLALRDRIVRDRSSSVSTAPVLLAS